MPEMEIKHDNMNHPDNFPGIGKRLPYREPEGFFDQLPERTLEKARQRTRSKSSLRIVWKAVAVAASVAAVVFLVILSQNEPQVPVVAETKTEEVEPPVIQEEHVSAVEKEADTPKVVVPQKEQTIASPEENVGDVLADLTDEELLQMAAMFEADLFTEDRNMDN